MNNCLYLGCDPDLRTLNCALLTCDKIPLAIFLRRNKSKRTGDGAVADAVKVAGLLADDVLAFLVKNEQYQNRPIVLIAESQSMERARREREENHRKVSPQDILHTGQITGVLMGVFGCMAERIYLLQPMTWKKGVKKPVHHHRILTHLNLPYKKLTSTKYPECYEVLSQYSGNRINPGDFEDINDSLGLALYGAENNL